MVGPRDRPREIGQTMNAKPDKVGGNGFSDGLSGRDEKPPFCSCPLSSFFSPWNFVAHMSECREEWPRFLKRGDGAGGGG